MTTPASIEINTQNSCSEHASASVCDERVQQPSKSKKFASVFSGRNKKEHAVSDEQQAINKALIKQYGQPPEWAAESNSQYIGGVKSRARGAARGAIGLGAAAGAGGGC